MAATAAIFLLLGCDNLTTSSEPVAAKQPATAGQSAEAGQPAAPIKYDWPKPNPQPAMSIATAAMGTVVADGQPYRFMLDGHIYELRNGELYRTHIDGHDYFIFNGILTHNEGCSNPRHSNNNTPKAFTTVTTSTVICEAQ